MLLVNNPVISRSVERLLFYKISCLRILSLHFIARLYVCISETLYAWFCFFWESTLWAMTTRSAWSSVFGIKHNSHMTLAWFLWVLLNVRNSSHNLVTWGCFSECQIKRNLYGIMWRATRLNLVSPATQRLRVMNANNCDYHLSEDAFSAIKTAQTLEIPL